MSKFLQNKTRQNRTLYCVSDNIKKLTLCAHLRLTSHILTFLFQRCSWLYIDTLHCHRGEGVAWTQGVHRPPLSRPARLRHPCESTAGNTSVSITKVMNSRTINTETSESQWLWVTSSDTQMNKCMKRSARGQSCLTSCHTSKRTARGNGAKTRTAALKVKCGRLRFSRRSNDVTLSHIAASFTLMPHPSRGGMTVWLVRSSGFETEGSEHMDRVLCWAASSEDQIYHGMR